METFVSRYKNPLVLALVLAAQFFLLAVQVRRPFPAATARVDQAGVHAIRYGVATVVTPPESVLHRGGLSFRNIWSSYLDLVGVREQNRQLKDEVDQLRLEQAALAEDARQGERLQDLLAFRQHYIQQTVPAQVVGTSGTDRSRVLFLDKGADDGIAPDMAVITPDGVVGRIREVYPHTAQVLEISDPTSAAGVLLEETRTRGILRGNTQGQPQIVNIMPDDRIKPGQLVLTSGGDQIFPRGLPVGVVDHIAPDRDNEPMVDVVLKPAANLNRLEEVLVVTGTGPAPTERARRDVAKSSLVAAGARAADEVAVSDDVQRASDVLAQRLPSRMDPADLAINPDSSPDVSPATSEAEAKPLHPPSALHPDHYTPSGIPSAESLTPGQRYAPLVEGTLSTERRARSTSGGDENATDTAPVSGNPAFAAAAAGMAEERKAAAEAKAAEAARRYAATHPKPPETPASQAVDATGESVVANAAVPTPAVRYVTRVNADGMTSRVAVPATPAGAGTTPVVRYVNRVNADGTTSRVAVPVTSAGAGTTPAARYVNRVNADGTTSRVAVPATPAGAGTTPAVRYVNRVNADGTTSRVAVPATSAGAGTTPGVRYVTRVNADGTVTRVAIPVTPKAPGAVAPSKALAQPKPPATGQVPVKVVTDGPMAPGSTRAPVAPRTTAAPRTTSAPHAIAAPASSAAAGTSPAAKPVAPKRKSPVLVPDDGSRPPPRQATPPANTSAPVSPQGGQ